MCHLSFGLEGINLTKSLAASLEFCWSRAMYKIFNFSDSACVETILFYMGIYRSLTKLIYVSSGSTTICIVVIYVGMTLCGTLYAHATKRRFIDELFWSHRVYITSSMPSYYRAVWSAFTVHIVLLSCLI
jgi:hypothetical protein